MYVYAYTNNWSVYAYSYLDAEGNNVGRKDMNGDFYVTITSDNSVQFWTTAGNKPIVRLTVFGE